MFYKIYHNLGHLLNDVVLLPQDASDILVQHWLPTILKCSCLDVEQCCLSVTLVTLWVGCGMHCLVWFFDRGSLDGFMRATNRWLVSCLLILRCSGAFEVVLQAIHRTCSFPLVFVRCVLKIIIIINIKA